jgi:hypothetical protein
MTSVYGEETLETGTEKAHSSLSLLGADECVRPYTGKSRQLLAGG